MAAAEKLLKIQCAHCDKPFHVRVTLAQPEAAGSGEVALACLYCEKQVMVRIPREYIAPAESLRGLPSRAG